MNFSRRLLIYVILFVTLNVYAFGFSNLISWIIDLTGIIGNVETQNIAPFLAAIIVCLPIWIFLWKFSHRTVQNAIEEESSTVRNLVTIITKINPVITLIRLVANEINPVYVTRILLI